MTLLYREFVDAGYPVIGIHPIVKGKCQCGNPDCQVAGKHPYSTSWQASPLWSDDQLETMEEMGQFDTGYGVLLRNLLVIDVDARNKGLKSLDNLLKKFPEIAGAGFIVETGSKDGSKHFYFTIPEKLPLVTNLGDYPGIDFKSSGYVVGPGSLHKSGKRYEVVVGSIDDIAPAPEALIAALKKPDRIRSDVSGHDIDMSIDEIKDMMLHIPNSGEESCDYEQWIRIGMALHHITQGTGFDIWDEWSRQSNKYVKGVMDSKWHSFGKSQTVVGLGTLAYFALKNGWNWPVEFESSAFEDFTEEDKKNGYPIDISSVDILRPPGFVGEIADWINSRSRRPREYLAVSAAITAIGNCIGLTMQDEYTGVTSNIYSLCVSGSATGKESIQQAVHEIHRAAGIAGACHGTIKSEQEILRNLTRHQAAIYVIDEIGIFLQKLKKAAEKGNSAPYLEGVIGCLMSAYSKADGVMPISGDLREHLQQVIQKELSIQAKKEDDNPGSMDAELFEKLKQQLADLDQGLKNPFVSMIGYTTLVTFHSCVDKESATNGFLSRAMITIEHETAPRYKCDYNPRELSDAQKNILMFLASTGVSNRCRVEQFGERMRIPSTDDAKRALDAIRNYFDDEAFKNKSNGLESIDLRAFENVAKISFILAATGGVRTVEHVRYAFAYVIRDIKIKIPLVQSNDLEKESPKAALIAKIIAVIGPDGETVGVICNRCRPRKKADVQEMIKHMLEKNILVEKEVAYAFGTKLSKRLFVL